MRHVAAVFLVLLLVAGCSEVKADQARRELSTARASTEARALVAARQLGARWGVAPDAPSAAYESCSIGIVNAIQLTEWIDIDLGTPASIDEVARQAQATRFRIVARRAATRTSDASLDAVFGQRDYLITVRKTVVTVETSGRCVDVTDQQANHLLGPVDVNLRSGGAAG